MVNEVRTGVPQPVQKEVDFAIVRSLTNVCCLRIQNTVILCCCAAIGNKYLQSGVCLGGGEKSKKIPLCFRWSEMDWRKKIQERLKEG